MKLSDALEILNLKPPFDIAAAKKAYRLLAKKHHPDRAQKIPEALKAAEEMMKNINLAFRTVTVELKKRPQDFAPDVPGESDTVQPHFSRRGEKGETVSKKRTRRTTDRKASAKPGNRSGWSDFFKKMGSAMEGFFASPPKASRRKKNKSAGFKTAGRVRRRQPGTFNEVFETVWPSSGIGAANRTTTAKRNRSGSGRRKNASHSAMSQYQKYMALKKRMRAGALKRSQGVRIEPIQKVSRVKPVSRTER